MNIFRKLFMKDKKEDNKIVDEDEGYDDHLVHQTRGPHYCGTAFCGHSTKAAARKCWKDKCESIDRIQSQANTLRVSGKIKEAEMMESTEIARHYPENNPINWPCNRSATEMQREYIEKAKLEHDSLK